MKSQALASPYKTVRQLPRAYFRRPGRQRWVLRGAWFAACAFLACAATPMAFAANRTINVKDFGAVGDGVHDDTYAIQLALNNASTTFNTPDPTNRSGVAVIFPAGDYVITNRLQMNATNFPANGGGIMIRGASTLTSHIINKAGVGGMLFTLTGQGEAKQFIRLQINDLKFLANATINGPAIEIRTALSPPNKGTPGFRPMLRNVVINRTSTAYYYTYGILITGDNPGDEEDHFANRSMFDNVSITLKKGSGIAGIQIHRSYAFNIIDSDVSGAICGLNHTIGGEGGIVNRCKFSNVDYGVVIAHDPLQYYMSNWDGKILNSSIAATKCGAKINSRAAFWVSNNNMSSEATGNYTDVELTGCGNSFVTGNNFTGSGSSRTGVALLPRNVAGKIAGARTLVADNLFGNLTTAVSVGTGVRETMVVKNSSNQATLPIVDAGVGTSVISGAPNPLLSPAALNDDESFSWANATGNRYDVKVYNAKGNGTSDDDTTYIQAAANAAVSYLINNPTGKAVLHFPAGTYKLTDTININTSSGAQLVIQGDGMGVSVLEQHTAGKGIFNVNVPASMRTYIHDLTVASVKPGAGTGISVKQTGTPAARSLYMYNTLLTQRGAANNFTTGIHLENLLDPLLQKVRLASAISGTGTGIKAVNCKGITTEHLNIGGQMATGLDIANQYGGNITFKAGMELCVGPDTSAIIAANSGNVFLDGCHMNCQDRHLVISTAASVALQNSLTLNHDFYLTETTQANIKLDSCNNVRIQNMIFRSGDDGGRGYNPNRAGIWLSGTANSNVNIYGNFFNEKGACSIKSGPGWPGPTTHFNRYARTDTFDHQGGSGQELNRIYALNGLMQSDYLIRNKASGKYLVSTGTPAAATTCNTTLIGDGTLWNIIYDRPSGRYLLTNKKFNTLLRRNNTDVDCAGTANNSTTQWVIWKYLDEFYSLKNLQGSVAYLDRDGDAVDCDATAVDDESKWEMILAEDHVLDMVRITYSGINGTWQAVPFERTFDQPPAVFASIGGPAGANPPVTLRVRNITTTGCDIMAQTWNGTAAPSGLEMGLITLYKGSYDFRVERQQVDADSLTVGTIWQNRTFQKPFTSPPVVFVQCSSANEADPVCARVRNVTTSGFEVRLQEQSNGAHANETVDYIAIAQENGRYFDVGLTNNVSSSWKTITFTNNWTNPSFLGYVQTFNDGDPCTLRYDNATLTKNSTAVKVDDPLGAHGNETAGWMAFGPPEDEEE